MFDRLAHLQPNLDKLVPMIKEAQRFLVSMHCRPDGDAAGSAVAMWHILRALGKDVTVFNVDEIPDTFTFLPGAEHIVRELSSYDYDMLIVLDCAEPSLLGRKFPHDKLSCPRVFIDHHSVPYTDCVVNLHDSKASAVGEILFHLCRALDVALTKDIAAALYTSIITDTGSFRYTSTSADAMRVCSFLLATDIDVWDIASHIYENVPAEKMRLLGLVLQTLWISRDGRLACLHANRQMLKKCHCSGAMTDGFINYARSIHGVEVSIFLTQLEEDLYRLSFRSRGNIDVSEIAARFGGGGHKNAAACTLRGSVESLRNQVEEICNREIFVS
ncbi:MAG: bifunctional oligoribonuclease/PAP phosphatase NrnA [Proteobacteria bacterium]|nr:bifunctional oligoribonuclease/PAP phosphatase NrnA [Pseudomonadota bacterium]